jgi:hypothetical protein
MEQNKTAKYFKDAIGEIIILPMNTVGLYKVNTSYTIFPLLGGD